jgi:MoaA/NifB/PqqE/SkfB family radical SAM enzyme
MYDAIYFEISGVCNSHCPWCVTGNRSKLQQGGAFIEPDLFKRALIRIKDQSLVHQGSIIYLYNWGEAFLHPQFPELLSILVEQRLKFTLSTNGSRLSPLSSESLGLLNTVIFSIPGFSQTSYDRIHRFNFNEITDSVAKFIGDIRGRGFSPAFRMAFHIYQFNIHEMPLAMTFCKDHAMEFAPVAANMGDYDLARQYLSGELGADMLRKAGRDLLLYYVDDLVRSRPAGYVCPQLSCLAIDENCTVLTCCALPRGYEEYAIGSLFELTGDQIRQMRQGRDICTKCGALGLDYWGHNPLVPPYVELFKSWADNQPTMRVLRAHYEGLVTTRLNDFVRELCTIVETRGAQEALAYYSQYRWCFPDVSMLEKVDAMMSRVA